jgi:hypothetical protein
MDRKKNIFDKIGSLIPGYRGYAEREGRRNCDKILREEIVTKLNEAEKILYKQMNEALKQKDKELMNTIEEIRKEVNTLSSRVKFAPYGATAFFTDGQIKEDELHNIHQIDLDLSESIENLRNNVSTSQLAETKEMLVSSQAILDKRNSYINEFK